MAFENISKRRLVFAPKHIVLRDDQEDLRIHTHKTNYLHTESISAPSKMIFVMSEGNREMFEKLPELTQIDGSLSLAAEVTLIVAKLQKINGDLHVLGGARLYAPMLEEVTGYTYLENGATVNAPKIEHLFANDDATRIEQQADNWLENM